MERNTQGFSSSATNRHRGSGQGAGRCCRLDLSNPASRRVNRSLRAAEFDQFSQALHRDLNPNPRSPLEQLVARQAIRSAWRLKANLDAEVSIVEDITPLDATENAARSLEVAMTTLEALQGRSAQSLHPVRSRSQAVSDLELDLDLGNGASESNEWPILPTSLDYHFITKVSEPEETIEAVEAPAWRDRLVYDFDVSDESPVVKGTWITVSHVVSLIIDGATWADILRSHPELSEEDIRMCVGYAIADENSAL